MDAAYFTTRRGSGAARWQSALIAHTAPLTAGKTVRAGRALLKGLGFAEIGIHRRHGRLDGIWRDCVIVERLLDTPGAEDQ